uniref:Uncharacterized protein n=1 Tax=Lepeophtheirus salmonis TaxID=72036 RepID=A0A0K2TH15_LEPSM
MEEEYDLIPNESEYSDNFLIGSLDRLNPFVFSGGVVCTSSTSSSKFSTMGEGIGSFIFSQPGIVPFHNSPSQVITRGPMRL